MESLFSLCPVFNLSKQQLDAYEFKGQEDLVLDVPGTHENVFIFYEAFLLQSNQFLPDRQSVARLYPRNKTCWRSEASTINVLLF